jgi:hypothetical protein
VKPKTDEHPNPKPEKSIPLKIEKFTAKSASSINWKSNISSLHWSKIGSSKIDNAISTSDYLDFSRIYETDEGYYAVWVLSDFTNVQPHIPSKEDYLPKHASRFISLGIDCVNNLAGITANMVCAKNMGLGRCVDATPLSKRVQAPEKAELLQLPDGSAVKVRIGESKLDALYRAYWMYPEAFNRSLENHVQHDTSPMITPNKFVPVESENIFKEVADVVCKK